MHAHSSYDIRIEGTQEEIDAIAEVVSEFVGEEVEQDSNISVEETYECVWLEDIVVLAIQMAKAAPAAKFEIEGVVDTSESAGEYMDFLITYKDKQLVSKNSCWYVTMNAYAYADYEEFSEDYLDENDEPRFTEEQYEEFLEGDYYILESGNGDCVNEVPLDCEKVVEIDWDSED